ncbi:MAG: sulfatase [Planctomycetaceae bacterium]|jgi:arylsulfatase A-like enzyme|nr:sulfatase [Planctomycetaceae bacterium]
MKNFILTNLSFYVFPVAVLLSANVVHTAENSKPDKPNILFIAVDDLRTELGCYGKERIKSPNIDRLASQGVVFEHAYCMVSVCGASRSALLTGTRPKYNRFVSADVYASKDAPNAIPLNTHFKNHGYTTVNNGKVYHHPEDHNDGWSQPAWRPNGPGYALEESQKALEKDREYKTRVNKLKNGKPDARGPAWESADVADDFYRDGKTLKKSLNDLRKLAKANQSDGTPFLLAVGFVKPHLPFVAPKKYWDLYKEEDIVLPENFRYIPKDAPAEAVHNFSELRNYANIPKGNEKISDETAKNLIHGYYAAVSYTDSLIGRLLDELESLGIADNTIVVLWGDHGWNLGEHTMWSKVAVFENTMNAPLILRLPGQKEAKRFSLPVEFIDIYPTLNELAGLPEPQKEQLQGKSLIPLIEKKIVPDKLYAAGRYGAGDTIFDGRYRYSEFRDKKGGGELVSRMLYDHQTDPRENINVVNHPENAAIIDELSKELKRTIALP